MAPVRTYPDPATGEWVGEHETRLPAGEICRQTEWFGTHADARQFARTGPQPPAQCPRHSATDQEEQYP